MNQRSFYNLKPGDIVRLTNDETILDQAGFSRTWAGAPVKVTKIDSKNNKGEGTIVILGSNYIIRPELVEHIQKDAKSGKGTTPFGKREVDVFVIEGGNARLASELAARVNKAREELCNAVKPEEFYCQLNKVSEQLRQARLIRAAMKLVK